jgi:hypothetical protein
LPDIESLSAAAAAVAAAFSTHHKAGAITAWGLPDNLRKHKIKHNLKRS